MIEGKPAQLGAMLIDLDSVMDTVQGTLAAISPTLYAKNAAGNYFDRLRDEFDGISKEDFQAAYAKRGAVELMLSTVTPAVMLIRDFVKKVNSLGHHGPLMIVPRVDVNFYPFTPPEHVREHILNGIRAIVAERFDISAVCIDPAEITFDYVRLTYDHLVMYDSGPFLEGQVKDGELKRGIPNVTIMGPVINRSEEDFTKEELYDRAMNAAADFAPLFNWLLLPIEVFCSAANPHKMHSIGPSPRPEGPSEEVPVSKSDEYVKPDDQDENVFGID